MRHETLPNDFHRRGYLKRECREPGVGDDDRALAALFPPTPHTSLTLEPAKSNIRKKSFAGSSRRFGGKHVTRVASDDAALFRRPEAYRGPPESLGDKAPFSDMADGYQIQPSLIFLAPEKVSGLFLGSSAGAEG